MDPGRVEECDHDDGAEVVDHGQPSKRTRSEGRHTLAQQRQDTDRERDVRGHGGSPSRAPGRPA